MAVDIKKVLISLKERKETMLVWGLGAVALCLGIFLLLGYMREISPPSSLEVIAKRKKPLKSKAEIREEVVAKLKETQRISPFLDYQDILTKNLFIQSRMVPIEGEIKVGTKGFNLKGIWKETGRIVAFIQDPEGKAYPVGVGQTIGTSEVKVVAIDFKNQTAALMAKGWEKPQVISLARVSLEDKAMITFRPSKERKKATEEEAKKAIASAKRAISKADSSIVDAVGTAADTSEATEKRDKAKEKLTEAQEAYLTKDYTITRDLALEAKNLAQEAVELVEEAIEEEEKEPEGGEKEEVEKDLEKEAGEDERKEKKDERSPKEKDEERRPG